MHADSTPATPRRRAGIARHGHTIGGKWSPTYVDRDLVRWRQSETEPVTLSERFWQQFRQEARNPTLWLIGIAIAYLIWRFA